jgi:glyoxylase-like metal-dependent hydrolase (beta-lactamase superfamily II)
MEIKKLITGPLQNNIYFIIDQETKKAVMIDCGQDANKVIDFVDKAGLKIEYIIFTHNHYDHTEAAEKIIKHFNTATTAIHKNDDVDNIEIDLLLEDNDNIQLDDIKINIIHTPGHTKGSICLYIKENGILISGDTLFKNGVGRTDLAGGSSTEMKNSLKKLFKLPDKTIVYPGHGVETTIGDEKRC